jgi:tetratricopeptide (TPR) repeat protein
MAEITLRAYIKVIDDLIEQQNLDEAISHCRRILESYPKHLETYRLLGKSYLEAKRYGDAADIFQRVLSAAPDDFVSHIGMAIIREDEGNLDSAIWHMERAFETNPANPAIQQELRRLIGNRDGIEPAKVRMTRGALARMYAHGELYSQAIAELRAALQEDPERPDLQVMLSSMYWRTNQYLEAAEVGNQILEKLPYCLEANRIMASVLRVNNKTEEASTYHRRLAAIDPYMAFVEDASIDPETVDASSVKLERLDWSPGQPMPSTEPGKPSWAASLGVKLGDTDSGTLKRPSRPTWLDELGKSTQKATSDMNQDSDAPPPFTPDESSDSASPEAERTPSEEQAKSAGSKIPEWMSEAGWTESTGEVQEGPISFSDDELDSLDAGVLPSDSSSSENEATGDEDAELAPAEIPNWMQEIAPDESAAQGGSGGSKLPDWLGDIAADMSEVAPSPGDSAPPISNEPVLGSEPEIEEAVSQQSDLDDEDESGSIPGWLGAQEPGATSTIITWLGDRESQELKKKRIPFDDDEEEPTSEEAVVKSEVSLPEWFEGSKEPGIGEPTPAEAYAGGFEPVSQADSAAAVGEQPEGIFTPEKDLADQAQAAALPDDFELTPSETPPDAEPAAEAPDWLQNIAAPDSLELSKKDFAAALEEEEELVAGAVQTGSVEAPSWLENLSRPGEEVKEMPQAEAQQGLQAAPEAAQPAPEVAKAPDDDTLDWLSDLDSKEMKRPTIEPEQITPAAEEVEFMASAESIQSEEAVDWLAGIGEPEIEQAAPSFEAPSMQETPDWLQSIDEPATEDVIEETPSEEEAPDWLDGIAEPDSREFKITAAEEDTIDWLKEIATDETDQQPAPAVERPIGEKKLVDTGSLEAFADEIAAADTTDLKDDEVFDWLEDLAAKQSAVEQEASSTPQDWQADSADMGAPAAPIMEEQHIPEEPQQGLDWLEDLAAQRGLDVDVGIEPSVEPPVQ